MLEKKLKKWLTFEFRHAINSMSKWERVIKPITKN